ncbi:hypothetical protein GCM10011581_39370 [Saccharopolyspora subtropica]|uniref:SAM-dependent methyltransferase n=1 Tax=Saccharopolyspora thermophila TaxID=89367 RepID=A0A917K291_9PSEU|nr:SAM-dependent methyltransferase [Saccharopolyspora subtropica]GGI98376.1 hypothetical protein GCM10011581_39370 [Saccharopolyspora subtropica]
MAEHAQIPYELNPDRPSGARAQNFLLGGSANLASDRALARRVLAVAPEIRLYALAGRACLHRVVRMCLAAGVRQFLDIGCGIPTDGNTHEIAQRAAPEARVMYIDSEPVAVTHGELLLEGNPNAAIVRADLRDTARVLTETRRLLDLAQPVAVLMFSVLHFVPEEDDPAALLTRYLDAVPSGSYLALTHLTADHAPETMRAVFALLQESQLPGTPRSRAALEKLLAHLDLLEPGIVPITEWRPDPADPELKLTRPLGYAAVARKP